MKYLQVRSLARRYAAGQLSQENYRSQRRVLIDSISSGQQALSYKEEAVKASPRRGHAKLTAFAVVAILLLAVVLKLSMRAAHGTHKAPDASAAAASVAPPPNPGPDLVRGFVETNDWSDPSLESFAERWVLLGPDDQDKARKSLMYPRLVAGLRQQVTSEKAVAGGGQDTHLSALEKVAKTLAVAP